MLGKRLEISVISCLIIGLIGYSALGIAIASDRISHAERTLNGVIAHQNMLNASFQGINSQLSTLGSSPAFDVDKTLALIDQSVAGYELTARTVSHDDAALSATERQLIDQRWLTMVSADRLDRVHARIGHARRALAMARDVAADEILDGQFWRELYRSLADMKKAEGQKAEGDLSAARTTLAQMQVDIDQAARLSTSPGLPPELQSLSADMQRFAADYGKQLDALSVGDFAGITAYGAAVSADSSKLGTYDVDGIGAEIDAYFKPLIDRYNREIVAATT